MNEYTDGMMLSSPDQARCAVRMGSRAGHPYGWLGGAHGQHIRVSLPPADDEKETESSARLVNTKCNGDGEKKEKARAQPPRFPDPPSKSIGCIEKGLVGSGPMHRTLFCSRLESNAHELS